MVIKKKKNKIWFSKIFFDWNSLKIIEISEESELDSLLLPVIEESQQEKLWFHHN